MDSRTYAPAFFHFFRYFLLSVSSNPIIRLLRYLFFAVVVRAVVLVGLGLTVRHRERLPKDGPAVFAGNHNSNLDALAIMSLLPLKLLPRLRPVAAMDYFYSSGLRAWFATTIIPVKRDSGKEAATRSRSRKRRSTAARSRSSSRKDRAASPWRCKPSRRASGILPARGRKRRSCRCSCMGSARRCPRARSRFTACSPMPRFVSELEAAMAALTAQEKLPLWE
ncbi:MAG TPA: 1-acyl-sn-glycerol-3-phosphate acyltransferase [Methyloceanibacter sp.]|nr:1-acyl-sn-glycerol-3-phosphate acyltransferase [Methyloceanibacter sp.]